MFLSSHIGSKTNKGQAMVEYLLVTAIVAIVVGVAVRMLSHAMSSYFSFLITIISLPIP